MAVKDGRLLEGPPGRGRFTAFETPIDKVQRPAKGLKNARFATPKQHGIAGQIVPSNGSWSWCRQLLNCLPMKKNRPVLMLRCLGRLPLQWQRQGSADIHSYIKVYIYYIYYIYIYNIYLCTKVYDSINDDINDPINGYYEIHMSEYTYNTYILHNITEYNEMHMFSKGVAVPGFRRATTCANSSSSSRFAKDGRF